MPGYADVDGYNQACPECGRWRFEHEDDCIAREPVECRNAGCTKQASAGLDGYCSRVCSTDDWFHTGIER